MIKSIFQATVAFLMMTIIILLAIVLIISILNLPTFNFELTKLWWVPIMILALAIIISTIAVTILSLTKKDKEIEKSSQPTEKEVTRTNKVIQLFWEQDKPGRRLFIVWALGNLLTIAVMPSYGKFITEHFLFWLGINGLLGLCLPLIWAGSNGNTGQKFLTLLALLAVIIGAWNWAAKKPSFYTKAGELKKFLVDDGEGKVYPFEVIVTKDGSKKYRHSPATGKPLRPGTPEDIERLDLDKSLLDRLRLMMPKVQASEVDRIETGPEVLPGQSFVLEIPPAPQWSRPLVKGEIPPWATWKITSPRGEYRIQSPKGEERLSTYSNPKFFRGDEWIGYKFQSTSSTSEDIIVNW